MYHPDTGAREIDLAGHSAAGELCLARGKSRTPSGPRNLLSIRRADETGQALSAIYPSNRNLSRLVRLFNEFCVEGIEALVPHVKVA